jgi:hypothetical protein
LHVRLKPRDMMNGIMADTLSHLQPFARIISTAGSIAARGASLFDYGVGLDRYALSEGL